MKTDRRGAILKKLEKDNFEPQFVENHEHIFQEFLENGLKQFMEYGDNNELKGWDNNHLTLKDLPVSNLLYVCNVYIYVFIVIIIIFIFSPKFYIKFYHIWIWFRFFEYLKYVGHYMMLPLTHYCTVK